MPGLTIVCDPGDATGLTRAALAALSAAHHFEDYRSEVLWRAPGVLVAATRYGAYPLAVIEAGPDVVVLEGRVYDRTPAQLADELVALARRLAPGGAAADADLASWLGRVDGDFVLAVVQRASGRVLVANDRYGRLPLYQGLRGAAALVTREIGLAVRLLDARRLDGLAVAQFLVFGYPLGQSTLFASVERTPPATRIVLPGGATRTLLVHDFGEKDPADPALAARLAGGLVEASVRRAGAVNVVSLSGGLDSRMVAAALRCGGVPLTAATHVDDRDAGGPEAAVAEQVARELGVPWRLLRLCRATGGDVERLLALKYGANYLGMGRVVPFLDALRATHGSGMVFFAGDQGDRLLGDRTPVARLGDDDALVDYVLRREGIIDPATAAAATGVSATRLHETVRERLAGYPEREVAQRYVHFLFYERAIKWVFEGEDRNRAWFWHVTPFSAPAVFEAAIRAPDARKAHDRLRADVLAVLSPPLRALRTAGSEVPPGSLGFTLVRRAERLGRAALVKLGGARLERRLARLLRPARGYAHGSPHVRAVARQLSTCTAVREALDPRVVRRILDDAPHLRGEQFSVLLTVTSVLETLTGEARTLEDLRTSPLL